MAFVKKVKERFRLWRKWRKYDRGDFPLCYIGPTVPTLSLEHGTPLQKAYGPRGTSGGARFITPDGVTRLLHKSHVKER